MNNKLIAIFLFIYMFIVLNLTTEHFISTNNNLIIVENNNFIFVNIKNKQDYKIIKIYKNIFFI